MPGDEHLAVITHEAQLFDAAHTGLSRMGETPIWEIQKVALKDSQADDCQRIDCHEKGQWPFQPIFPLSPKSSLAGLARLHITEPPIMQRFNGNAVHATAPA